MNLSDILWDMYSVFCDDKLVITYTPLYLFQTQINYKKNVFLHDTVKHMRR